MRPCGSLSAPLSGIGGAGLKRAAPLDDSIPAAALNPQVSIRQLCEARDLRLAGRQGDIVDLLDQQPGAFHVDDVLAAIAAGGHARVPPATIYRTLRHLVEAGVVVSVGVRHGKRFYRPATGATVTFVDEDSGRAVEVCDAELRERISALAAQAGLTAAAGGIRIVLGAPRGSAKTA